MGDKFKIYDHDFDENLNIFWILKNENTSNSCMETGLMIVDLVD